MEIKLCNCDMDVKEPENADEYGRLIQAVVRSLFLVSGIKRDQDQIIALSHNLHAFLVENKDLIIGIINAGRIKG